MNDKTEKTDITATESALTPVDVLRVESKVKAGPADQRNQWPNVRGVRSITISDVSR